MFELYYNFHCYVTGCEPLFCVFDLSAVYKHLRESPRSVFFSASRMYYFDKVKNRPTYCAIGSRVYERLYESVISSL